MIIPKTPVPPDHKLKTLGSHPQLVKDAEVFQSVKTKLLNADYIADDEALLYGDPQYVPEQQSTLARQKRIKERLDIFLNDYENLEIFHGCFVNYFSMGKTAEIVCSVENTRNTECGKRIFGCGCGKGVYAFQSARKGAFCKCAARTIADESDLYFCDRLRPETELEVFFCDHGIIWQCSKSCFFLIQLQLQTQEVEYFPVHTKP